MRKIKLAVVTFICACLVVACSANTNEGTNSNLANGNQTVKEESTPTNASKQKEEPTETEAPDENNEIKSILDASLSAMQAVNKIELFVEETSDYIYYEGPGQMYFSSRSLTMERNPDVAREHIYKYSHNYVEHADGSIDVMDDVTNEYEYLFSKEDELLYYTAAGEDQWFQDELWHGYKTIGTLEDIVSYFIEHNKNAELYLDPVEGIELDEGEVGEYRRIQLNISTEQFVADTTKLTKYFIHPEFDQDVYLDQTYYLDSPELTDHKVWIMLDEFDRIIQYGVTMSTTDYDKTMYNVNHNVTLYAVYENYTDIVDVEITDEIRTMAEANTFPLE